MWSRPVHTIYGSVIPELEDGQRALAVVGLYRELAHNGNQ